MICAGKPVSDWNGIMETGRKQEVIIFQFR